MTDIPTEADTLSDDAKALLGGMFATMSPDLGQVTWLLTEHVPTDRTQVALDELTEAGWLTREAFGEKGVRYKVAKDAHWARVWYYRNRFKPSWVITKRIGEEG